MNNSFDNYVGRVEKIVETIESFLQQGKKPFATSSFQSHSIALLHILSRLETRIPIYFINTGFLFPETIEFRDKVTELLGLKVLEVSSTIPKIQQLNGEGGFFFTTDPARCCYINKVEPVNKLLLQYDIWISGIRADQTEHRRTLEEFADAPNDSLKYHPMLDWSAEDVDLYLRQHQLPRHPLEEAGYTSIGCQPCTAKDLSSSRNGRWEGLRKTECGLHTDLHDK